MDFYKEVDNLKKLTSTFVKKLDSGLNFLSVGNFESSNNLFFDAKAISEEITNKSRLLTKARLDQFNSSQKLDKQIIEKNGVFVSYLDNGGFYVKIPALLPKKNGGNPIFIRTTLALALEDFFSNNQKIRITKPATIIFKHNYNKNTPDRKHRDHDNIELNVVVDLIAMHVLPDDSPLALRHFYLSQVSNEDSTEVFVIENESFPAFLNILESSNG